MIHKNKSVNFVSRSTGVSLNNSNREDFRTEVETQCDIFTKSLKADLDPICPSIVYSDIITAGSIIGTVWVTKQIDFLKWMLSKTHPGGTTEDYLKKLINDIYYNANRRY